HVQPGGELQEKVVKRAEGLDVQPLDAHAHSQEPVAVTTLLWRRMRGCGRLLRQAHGDLEGDSYPGSPRQRSEALPCPRSGRSPGSVKKKGLPPRQPLSSRKIPAQIRRRASQASARTEASHESGAPPAVWHPPSSEVVSVTLVSGSFTVSATTPTPMRLAASRTRTVTVNSRSFSPCSTDSGIVPDRLPVASNSSSSSSRTRPSPNSDHVSCPSPPDASSWAR